MRLVALLALLLLTGLWLTGPCRAQPGPLLVILLPGTSLRGWQAANAPHLHRLMAQGAMGVMNTRTARLPGKAQREPEGALLTLGAGARAAGGRKGPAFQPAAVAGTIYTRRMGQIPPPSAAVAPDWPSVLRANTGRGYDIYPGNLADSLRAEGVKVGAGGGPAACWVAASSDGTVYPARSLIETDGLLVWDAGSDVSAADALLDKAAHFVAAHQGRLIVLSPFAGETDYGAGRRLTPVLEWGEGIPPGLLVSPSTRRPGLVTNTDFAPTVAAWFGPPCFPVRPFGQAWTIAARPNAEQRVSAVEQGAYRQAVGMQILPYVALFLAAWLAGAAWLKYRGRLPEYAALVPVLAALAALLAGTAAEATAWLTALGLAFLLAGRRFGSSRTLTAALAGLVALLTADLAAGSHGMQRSLLGYSAVEGARYYGIGNEAMGLLIGASLALTARFWTASRVRRVIMAGGLLLIALLLGAPFAGAKAGGLLVALLAFGAYLWEANGGVWSGRVLGTLLGVAAIVLGLTAFGDAVFGTGHASHFGEAVQRIRTGGISEAGDIAARKLAVELHLAWHSAWAALLWIGLGCFGRLGRHEHAQGAFLTGGLIAITASLLLNDAGVVAAALCLVPLWSHLALPTDTKKPRKTVQSSGA